MRPIRRRIWWSIAALALVPLVSCSDADEGASDTLVWPLGTTATHPPLRVVEPLGSVKSEGKYVVLRGAEHPWPEWPYDGPILNAGISRCADRSTDEVFSVGDDRL